MATKANDRQTSRASGRVKIQIDAKGQGKSRSLTYGTVTARVPVADRHDLERNVSAGHKALRLAGSKLMSPGVRLGSSRGVPLYHADPDRPGVILRQLDGKVERGIFNGRQFQVTE